MTAAKLGINGFGRIGRNAFKIAFERKDLEIVAINDLTDTKTLAYLLKHDSNYGTYQHEVSADDTGIIVDGKHIKVLAEKDPSVLPWGDLGVELVIESTGFFTAKEDAEKHITGGGAKICCWLGWGAACCFTGCGGGGGGVTGSAKAISRVVLCGTIVVLIARKAESTPATISSDPSAAGPLPRCEGW